jgi:hypothetical protein
MKGFVRRRMRLAIRFFAGWEKKTENRIAPPQRPGWCHARLEGLQIEEVGRIYISGEVLSIEEWTKIEDQASVRVPKGI